MDNLTPVDNITSTAATRVDNIPLGRLTVIPHEAARNKWFLKTVFGDKEPLRNVLRQYIPHRAQPSGPPERAVTDIWFPRKHFIINLERGNVELTVVRVDDLASLHEETLQRWGLYRAEDIPDGSHGQSGYLLAASYLRTPTRIGLDDLFTPYNIRPISPGAPANHLQRLGNALCRGQREVLPSEQSLDLPFFFYDGQVAAALSNPTSERIREAEAPIQEYFLWMEQNASTLRTITAAQEYATHLDHSATFLSGLSRQGIAFSELAALSIVIRDQYHALAERTLAALHPPINNRMNYLAGSP